MSSQPTFSHKHTLQPRDEEITVTASTLNKMDRVQYETLFADVLISYELLKIGESIGGGKHNIYTGLKKISSIGFVHKLYIVLWNCIAVEM